MWGGSPQQLNCSEIIKQLKAKPPPNAFHEAKHAQSLARGSILTSEDLAPAINVDDDVKNEDEELVLHAQKFVKPRVRKFMDGIRAFRVLHH